jgi:hypothetical protein
MSLNNDSFFHTVKGHVDSQATITAFDAFTARYAEEFAQTKIPCLVILDNAQYLPQSGFGLGTGSKKTGRASFTFAGDCAEAWFDSVDLGD